MNSYSWKQELARKNIKDLIDSGLNEMRNPNISEFTYSVWLNYSQKVLEISTKDYNPEILLNYLRVTLSMNVQLLPYQKIGICLDYLIAVYRVI